MIVALTVMLLVTYQSARGTKAIVMLLITCSFTLLTNKNMKQVTIMFLITYYPARSKRAIIILLVICLPSISKDLDH